ncbi:MAG: quinone oxidoreductase [Myxococcaceae bacterium]|nr:quinone oxidoreductase [Myxococcaceae bacterium]
MRAIRVESPGGPEALTLREVPTPSPGPGQVLVRVEAAGVNFIDVYQRTGRYALPLPFTPGLEGAGVVEAVGPGVEEFSPGARVGWAQGQGSYAEQVVLPAERCVPLPDGVSAEQAAAVFLQGMTAHFLSHSTYPIQRGDTVLVHAGAGGVGLLLIQMAVRRGARVLTTVSTEEKAALARGAGAHEVILYTTQDFVAETRRLTGGEGVHCVYDSVGKTTFSGSLDCLRMRGMLVLYGGSSGPVPPVDPMVLNAKGSLFLTRPTLFHYVADRASLLQRAGDVLTWVQRRELDVRIGRTYPLVDAAQAHRDLEGRVSTGKLLLRIR